ncbi:MAG: hypothetical protein C5B55_12280, partial [Blastocatellia bacterium]
MPEDYSTQRLLVLRKSTRAVSDLLRSQMKEYLSTLAPLFRPRTVLGNYVEAHSYEVSSTAEKPFKDLKELYQKISRSKTYQLPAELRTPLEVINNQLEMTPVEYQYVVPGNKSIVVTSPLKWALTYRGFGPMRFREVLLNSNRSSDELQQFVLHYLMM